MPENAVFVVVEVVSVEDAEGLRTYSERASQLIGPFGGRSWSDTAQFR